MNKGLKIGCGCALIFLVMVVIGIVWGLFYIGKNQDKIIGSIKTKANNAYNSMVEDAQITIDEFFEKYNIKDFEYICNEMYDKSAINNQNSCADNLNKFYETFGKEISYDISFPNAGVSVHADTSGKQYKIYAPAKFEKFENSHASFEMKSVGSQKLKISDFSFEINSNIKAN